MGYGQYSAAGRERMSKGEMLAAITAPIKESKMVARNTIQYETDDGDVVTRLHDTDIVRKTADGAIYIDTGGWNTATTRARINDALMGTPYHVHTDQGQVILRTPKKGNVRFKQHAAIGPRGKITTDIQKGEAAGYDEYRPYIERYLKSMLADGIPLDTGGDPWVAPEDGGKYAEQYVLEWLGLGDSDEPYVFGSFIFNAYAWSGRSVTAMAYRVRLFNEGDKSQRRYITGMVRRYIRACLGYASS